ncbi:CTR type copper ion transporter [Micractinium conductrix]|uniref:Copper transport protein n=1 Tax=Micractinium conductrix TaxID=554055 RepID=A0A2P6VSB8_9CHLO|nr:CTR type copper ion transporter [Micractinium conductrix]|eukprot:PSC76967.1 CTR type copper ion transporter [Micractinium conductrix]
MLRALALCVLLLSEGVAAQATVTIAPSRNTTDPCYANPSDAACADFQRSDADWTNDIEMLCAAMPYMIGCSLWRQCTSGKAVAGSKYCAMPSLVGDICGPDEMSRMKGCEAYDALCAPGTAVQQCLVPGTAPNVLTTFASKEAVDGVCTSHSMDGCQSCSSVGRTMFRDCPEVLDVLSKLCVSMPDMEQCAAFKTFCADADVAAGFPKVCTQDAADGSSSSLPPMKMWFHQSAREMFLFKEWVPNNTGQYVGLCFAMCALAVFTQFLKAVRLRVEMRWATSQRLQCVCPSPACADGDSDKASDAEAGTSAAAPKPCCGGGANGRAAAPPSPPVPTTSRVPTWRSRRRSTLAVCGVELISREQAVRNFWRACFTFVVIFLDYALMLVVMTYNVGIILAVCGGFAVGALLFGHAGERAPAPAAQLPAQPVKHSSASSDSEDLETVFVEGPGCCSGGTAAAHLSSTA